MSDPQHALAGGGPRVSIAARDVLVMAKPNGAVCNLDCSYCYYLDKVHLYPENTPFRMPLPVLEEHIVQCIRATPRGPAKFCWHGGEPTLLGLDYFREIVALQRKHLPRGGRAVNNLQTNGTTLDAQWCRFLAREGFFVGISLDGPQALHDRYRVTKGGKPSHGDVVRGLRLLQRHGVQHDVLCVVHDQNVAHPLEVYRFLRDSGVRSLSFLHLVERQKGASRGVGLRSVSPEAYGAFLCTVFDEWVRRDVGRVSVQIFDDALRAACGQQQALCIFRKTCGDVLVLEHNGDVYSCDHYVDPEHRLGNILETPLADLAASPDQVAFGQAKQLQLPRECRRCEVLDLCNGGCPKDRLSRTPDGEGGLNYLCAAYRRFFTHSRPLLSKLARIARADHPKERWRELLWPDRNRGFADVGRNDPCPCGSGHKFKQCCMRG